MSIPPTANCYLVEIRSKPQDLSLSSTLHSVLLPFYDQFPPFWSLHPLYSTFIASHHDGHFFVLHCSGSHIVILNMSEVVMNPLALVYPFRQNWRQRVVWANTLAKLIWRKSLGWQMFTQIEDHFVLHIMHQHTNWTEYIP